MTEPSRPPPPKAYVPSKKAPARPNSTPGTGGDLSIPPRPPPEDIPADVNMEQAKKGRGGPPPPPAPYSRKGPPTDKLIDIDDPLEDSTSGGTESGGGVAKKQAPPNLRPPPYRPSKGPSTGPPPPSRPDKTPLSPQSSLNSGKKPEITVVSAQPMSSDVIPPPTLTTPTNNKTSKVVNSDPPMPTEPPPEPPNETPPTKPSRSPPTPRSKEPPAKPVAPKRGHAPPKPERASPPTQRNKGEESVTKDVTKTSRGSLRKAPPPPAGRPPPPQSKAPPTKEPEQEEHEYALPIKQNTNKPPPAGSDNEYTVPDPTAIENNEYTVPSSSGETSGDSNTSPYDYTEPIATTNTQTNTSDNTSSIKSTTDTSKSKPPTISKPPPPPTARSKAPSKPAPPTPITATPTKAPPTKAPPKPSRTKSIEDESKEEESSLPVYAEVGPGSSSSSQTSLNELTNEEGHPPPVPSSPRPGGHGTTPPTVKKSPPTKPPSSRPRPPPPRASEDKVRPKAPPPRTKQPTEEEKKTPPTNRPKPPPPKARENDADKPLPTSRLKPPPPRGKQDSGEEKAKTPPTSRPKPPPPRASEESDKTSPSSRPKPPPPKSKQDNETSTEVGVASSDKTPPTSRPKPPPPKERSLSVSRPKPPPVVSNKNKSEEKEERKEERKEEKGDGKGEEEQKETISEVNEEVKGEEKKDDETKKASPSNKPRPRPPKFSPPTPAVNKAPPIKSPKPHSPAEEPPAETETPQETKALPKVAPPRTAPPKVPRTTPPTVSSDQSKPHPPKEDHTPSPGRPTSGPSKAPPPSRPGQAPKPKPSRPSGGPPSRPAGPPKPSNPPKPTARKTAPKDDAPPPLPPRPEAGHPLYRYVCTNPHGIAKTNKEATDLDELSFYEGDVIELIEKLDDHWYHGCNVDNDFQEGLVLARDMKIVKRLPGQDKVIEDGPCAVSTAAFEGRSPDELSFKEGTLIMLISRVGGEDWLRGRTLQGEEGIFPKSFVEVVEELPPDAIEEAPAPVSEPPDENAPDGPYCIAIETFAGETSDDLSFLFGDIIEITERIDESWLRGTCAGKSGMFPQVFVNIKVDTPIGVVGGAKEEKGVAQEEGGTGKKEDENIVTAVFDYEGQEGDLSFKEGDKIKLLSKVSDEWVYGELNGNQGMFPSSFIDHIPDNLPMKGEEEESVDTPTSTVTQAPPITGECEALFDYQSDSFGDLSFTAGERIEVTEWVNDEWLSGRIGSERSGMFPVSFVKIIKELPKEVKTVPKDSSKSQKQDFSATSDLMPKGKAIRNFEPSSSMEMRVQVGDIIILLSKEGPKWYSGENTRTGEFGNVPVNCIDVIVPLP